MEVVKGMDNQSLEERLQKNAKDIKGLRMFDDTFMSAVFDCQIEETECLLKIVLERDDLKVETTKTQYTISNEYGHEVRLDIRATDSQNRAYNVEVQRQKHGADVRRARFNAAMLDRTLLGEGQDYDQLPDRYTIFITEKDYFGKGLPAYHAENRIKELDNEPLGDGGYIVYINGQYRNTDSPIGRLMHDFFCSNPEEMLTPILRDRVRYLKETERGQLEVCELMERIVAEEVEKANEVQAKTIAEKMYKKKMPVEEIADFVGYSVEVVEKWLGLTSAI